MAGVKKKAGPAHAGLRFLSLIRALIGAFAPAPASAGAWVAPKGGREIMTRAVGEPSVVRAGVTAGFRPAQNWPLMGQVFYAEPTLGDQSLKTQGALARFGERGGGVQLGLRSLIEGEAQAALVLGFWGRPGD